MNDLIELAKLAIPLVIAGGGGVWVEKLRGEIAAQADRFDREIRAAKESLRQEANRTSVQTGRELDQMREDLQRLETSLASLRESHARTLQITEDTHDKSSKLFQEIRAIRDATHALDVQISGALAEITRAAGGRPNRRTSDDRQRD